MCPNCESDNCINVSEYQGKTYTDTSECLDCGCQWYDRYEYVNTVIIYEGNTED